MAVPERVKEVLLELLLLVLVFVLLVEAAALALSLLSKLLSHVGQRSEAAGTMQSKLARVVGARSGTLVRLSWMGRDIR